MVVSHRPCGLSKSDSEPEDLGGKAGKGDSSDVPAPLRPSASSGHSFKLNPASALQGPEGDNNVPELISDPLLTSSALRKNETVARKFCSFPVPNSEPAKVRSWWIWASIPGPSSCELPSPLLRSWQTIFV